MSRTNASQLDTVPANFSASQNAPLSSSVAAARTQVGHEPVMGVCWILYGLLRLLIGVLMFVYSSTATVMFGQLLHQVANPFALMGAFHFVYAVAIFLSAVVGVLGILAGIGLLAGGQSTRTLALFVAFLSLSNLPLGTTLGIYTLVVLLSANVARPHAA
jgi:hypothetical protein